LDFQRSQLSLCFTSCSTSRQSLNVMCPTPTRAAQAASINWRIRSGAGSPGRCKVAEDYWNPFAEKLRSRSQMMANVQYVRIFIAVHLSRHHQCGLHGLFRSFKVASCIQIACVVVTVALTWLCVALSPNDKSAGSVGIIIIGLLPIGVIVGAVVGLVRGRRKQL
jgi:hypothetical protein